MINGEGSLGVGIDAYQHSTVHVLGDYYFGSGWCGISALERAEVTIDGVYSIGASDEYVFVAYYIGSIGPNDYVEPTTKYGYLTYTAEDNRFPGTVWINANPVVVTLTGITVTAPPDKLEYTTGENLELAGIKVEAQYSNGSVRDVTALVTTDPAEGESLDAAGLQTVTVSYAEKGVTMNDSFDVEVSDPPEKVVLERIQVVIPPRKQAYTVNEALDLSEMVVAAYFSNGSEFEVTGSCETDPAEREVLLDLGT
jgi:hypothetical protein